MEVASDPVCAPCLDLNSYPALPNAILDILDLAESCMIEGSLEVKLPTIWRDGKAEVERIREEKGRREKIREEKESEERRCRCAKR